MTSLGVSGNRNVSSFQLLDIILDVSSPPPRANFHFENENLRCSPLLLLFRHRAIRKFALNLRHCGVDRWRDGNKVDESRIMAKVDSSPLEDDSVC